MRKLLPVLLLLTACSQNEVVDLQAYYRAEGDRLDAEARHKRVAYTFEDFIASPGYRDTRDMWRGGALAQYSPKNSRVEFLLKEQRGRLYINDTIAMDFPICSGRVGGQETPKGVFRISQKARQYRSNRYGSFVSRDGKRVVKSDISSSDAAPKGSVFKGASMPYWMRFNGSVGMHVGNVYRYSASHGCVRVPVEACSVLFEKLAVGSKVIVK